MKVPAIAVALIALYGESMTTQALTATTIEKNCKAMTVCYKGANKAVPCTIAQIDCPPCVTFNDDGCYEKKTDGTCSFGSLCSTYWDDDTPSTSGGSGSVADTPSAKSGSHGSAGVPTTGKNTTSTNSTSTSSHASAAGAGTAGSAASDSKGSDMSVVFAIIGAAMGVIAVAVIFLTLVRRSRAAHEDEDDVATPPAAMGGSKEPVSTTAAVTYASYDRNRGTSGGNGGAALANVAEPSVVSYYSQQPKDLPIASPRVAGRAVPAAAAATTTSVASYYAQQPQNLPAVSPRVAGRAVPAAARAVPVPAPAARAMPMFVNKAPLNNPHQQYQQETVYHQAPVGQVQVQEAPRHGSSPRNRRESFEF